MKKIPTIFKRNPERMQLVTEEINPVCLWVFDGKGVATRKYDGTCCMIRDGKFYKRREVKKGKTPPVGFERIDYDENTGKSVGWVLVEETDKWHMEGLRNHLADFNFRQDGTYELVGPKINKNPEHAVDHVLLPHSKADVYRNITRTFDGIRHFLEDKDIKGLVFHHPDGRMAKIKKRDFGLRRDV